MATSLTRLTRSRTYDVMFTAGEGGHLDLARLLLAMDGGEKRRLSSTTMDRTTPLHSACTGGHTAVIKMLLSRGAGIAKRTKTGARLTS